MARTETLLSPAELVQTQRWRYATKKFEPALKIPQDAWAALEQSLMLSPSSFGLQPWKFVVVTDPEVRARLRAASWNQAQVEDCSHLVVFLAKDTIREADVDHFLARTAEVSGQSLESLEAYKGMMMGGLVNGPQASQLGQWAARQAYIALGNFMTSAALLGVDTCPMEGFDPAQYRSHPGTGRQRLPRRGGVHRGLPGSGRRLCRPAQGPVPPGRTGCVYLTAPGSHRITSAW